MASAAVEDSAYVNAVGGALKLKGMDLKRKKKHKKKHKKRQKVEEDEQAAALALAQARAAAEYEEEGEEEEDPEAHLTPAQKRHNKRMREREVKAAEKSAAETHREKVERFNQKLSELTEHNDIPRVSAAGNG